jgi:deazaflavin-dependent oxidoreductase (nitroreductase family)
MGCIPLGKEDIMAQLTVNPTSFKRFNKIMIALYRLGLGPYISNPQTGYIMVLTTIGRKSGLKRRTPVNYAIVDGDIYCTSGFGVTSDWYRNLKANSQLEVWLGRHWWAGQAEEVTDPAEWLPLYRLILINSGFAAETFLGFDPATISNEALREIGADQPVIRIRVERELSGPGGPGDLVWIWPLAAAALLVACSLRRKSARALPTPPVGAGRQGR